MQASFDYFYMEMPFGQISLDDIGNFILQANDDDFTRWYLCCKTQLGITRIIEYGPVMVGNFPTNVIFTFTQMDYNEAKISKIIDKFLNNKARQITQVEELEEIPQFKSPMDYYLDKF